MTTAELMTEDSRIDDALDITGMDHRETLHALLTDRRAIRAELERRTVPPLADGPDIQNERDGFDGYSEYDRD